MTAPHSHILQVDESVERVMREECLHGRMCLLDDIRGGIHARNVISELNHTMLAKARGEHAPVDGDFEFRFIGSVHGAGFHAVAGQYDDYGIWGPDSDRLEWGMKRFPETRVKHTPRRTSLLMPGFAFKSSERLRGGPPAL